MRRSGSILLLSIALACTAATAQTPPGRPRPPPGAPPPPPLPPVWRPGDPLPPPPPPPAWRPPPQQAAPAAAEPLAAPAPAAIGDALPAAPEPVDADTATEPAPPIDTAAAPAAPIAAEVSPPVQTAKARPASPSTPLADPRMAPGIAATPAPSLGPGGWAMLAILACITGWWWRRSRALAQEARHLLRQQRALKSANVRLRDESERLRQQATNDPLTGALNRQAFATALRELLGHVAHYNRPAWLAVIDLDHFKAINDRHGHLAGDSALKLVAGIVHERLVSADLFGRFGGDEFLIGLAGHDADSAAALAESLRQAVAEAAARHAPPLPGLSLSIGLAHADPDAGYSADALFARADAALYEAKRSGRNRVVVANAETTLPETGSAARHL